MSALHVKPDKEKTIKHIQIDYVLMLLFCLSVIGLAILAWLLDWRYQPVFFAMAFVAFLFLGSKKEIPDETWTTQQNANWTKRFTTIKVKDGFLIYVFGEGPGDVDKYELSEIDSLNISGNRLNLKFKDGHTKKLTTKYWAQSEVKGFVDKTNKLLQRNS